MSSEDQDNRSAVEAETSTGVPLDTVMDNKYGARTGVHNLRARKRRLYGHLHVVMVYELRGGINHAGVY